VNQAEGGRAEQFALLSLAGGGLDEVRRIPFAEEHLEALQLQPPLEEIDLGGLAGAIQPFDGDQAPGKPEFCKGFRHCQGQTKTARGEHSMFLWTRIAPGLLQRLDELVRLGDGLVHLRN
jgi:hypothetical protein